MQEEKVSNQTRINTWEGGYLWLHAVGLNICLVDYIQAIHITQVVQRVGVRIVTSPQRVEVVPLH